MKASQQTSTELAGSLPCRPTILPEGAVSAPASITLPGAPYPSPFAMLGPVLACQGFHVLPLHGLVGGQCTCGKPCGKDAGKHPRVLGAYQAATTDRVKIRRWSREKPSSNIGIATGAVSGLIVVDLDTASAGTMLVATGRELPPTFSVRTARGWHLWYRSPPSLLVRSQGKLLDLPVDLLGEGKHVVGPGSNHSTGCIYTPTASVGQITLTECPDWIVREYCLSDAEVATVHGRLEAPAGRRMAIPKPEGPGDPVALERAMAAYQRRRKRDRLVKSRRNDGLRDSAWTLVLALRAEGVLPGHWALAVQEAMARENAERCSQPLGDPEVRKLSRQAVRKLLGEQLDAASHTPAKDGEQVVSLTISTHSLTSPPSLKTKTHPPVGAHRHAPDAATAASLSWALEALRKCERPSEAWQSAGGVLFRLCRRLKVATVTVGQPMDELARAFGSEACRSVLAQLARKTGAPDGPMVASQILNTFARTTGGVWLEAVRLASQFPVRLLRPEPNSPRLESVLAIAIQLSIATESGALLLPCRTLGVQFGLSPKWAAQLTRRLVQLGVLCLVNAATKKLAAEYAIPPESFDRIWVWRDAVPTGWRQVRTVAQNDGR